MKGTEVYKSREKNMKKSDILIKNSKGIEKSDYEILKRKVEKLIKLFKKGY